jgi:photosystem II stability/assembly factor-like uncharacterized protein
MLARLRSQSTPGEAGAQPLAALTTRDSDDPAIALLDAWAVTLDVLTFYQERIANEGYLRTATERRSIQELTRAIGYELRPGLAASVSLAFTVEATPGAPGPLTLAEGLRVQSLPGQDQLPQRFETVETITARPEWNTLRPYRPLLPVSPTIERETTSLQLAGVSAALQPGQRLLVMAGRSWYLPVVQAVEPDARQGYTQIRLERALQEAANGSLAEAVSQPQLFAFRQRAALFGHNAPRWEDVSPALKAVQGGVYHLADKTWRQIQAGLPYRPVLALAATSRGHLLAGTAGDGLYRSGDQGASWSPANTNLTNLMVHALLADAQGVLFAGTTEGMIFRSVDQGESWTRLSTGSLVEPVQTSDGSEAMRLVSNGLPSTTIYALAAAEQNGVSSLYAGTDNGIYQSTDEGVSWTRLVALKGVRALLITPDGNLLAGTRAGLFRSESPTAKATLTQFSHASLSGRAIQALALASDQNGVPIILAGSDAGLLTAAANATAQTPWTLLAGSEHQDIRGLAVAQDGSRFVATPLAGFTHADWPGFEIAAGANQINLDSLYPGLLADSWVALANREQVAPYRVRQASVVLGRDFGQEARITRLELATDPLLPSLSGFGGKWLRESELLIQSEALPLFETTRPLDTPVQGHEIELDRLIPPLEPGRRLVVSGRPIDPAGAEEVASEICFVGGTIEREGRTVIVLRGSLQRAYERASLTVRANVALATHGETISQEILGSGDGAQTNQRFRLKQSPLTYLPAPTTTGARSALTVRVNGIRWSEVDSLHRLDANSQSYVVRSDAEGRTTIIFGDGKQGARLPTGLDNVEATYRAGLGPAGEVPANSLTMLQSRPLGLVEATNPLPAAGAAAPETAGRARENAPRTVLSMDRIVSLSDFEDFARSFSGIGQAQAALLWTGQTRLVHITLADSDGEPLQPATALYSSLLEAMNRRRNQLQQIELAPYEPILFNLAARVYLDPRYLPDVVESAVRATLSEIFSFQTRTFGQVATASEVIAVIQRIPGVIYVDLDALYLANGAPALNTLLPALRARWSVEAAKTKPAQLLLLNPDKDGISLIMEFA